MGGVGAPIPQLPSTPVTVNRERFFFCHIQKAAGTSVRHALDNEFGADAIYPLPEDADDPYAYSDVERLRSVFEDRGDWYVRADDDRSGELRTFRIDRIRALQSTGETVPADDAELSPPGEWFADGAVPRVTLRVAPTASWVAERYPVDEVTEPDSDGWITLRLPVASER